MNRGRPIGLEVAARDLEPANAMTKSLLVAPGPNSRDVFIVRGERVMLDSVVAEAFGTETKRVNEAVSRNPEKFTPAHTFRLSEEEADALRSQIATSNLGRGGRRYLPYVFTEHGAVMAANVLNSPRAVAMSVHVVRAFVRLREMIASHKRFAKRLDELEARYDRQFKVVFDAIRELMSPPERNSKRRIGFV